MIHPDSQTVDESGAPRPLAVSVALCLIAVEMVAGRVSTLAVELASWSSEGVDTSSPLFVLAVNLVTIAIWAGLLAALFSRRRWAWWVWLVLFVLGLPGLLTGRRYVLDQDTFTAACYLLTCAAHVAAGVLLLLRPSRQWYGIWREPDGRNPWRWSDDPKEP
jgi:hypothetical protein